MIKDNLNPFCTCGVEVEVAPHFKIHCPYYKSEWRKMIFIASICVIQSSISQKGKASIIKTLLYRNKCLSET